MSKSKEQTKDLYVDHINGDNPSWWTKTVEAIEYSAPVLLLCRAWSGEYGIKNFPRQITWFFQRAIRGYSDNQLWSLDYYLGKHIVQCLRAFKDMAKNSYPSRYMTTTQKNGKSTDQSDQRAIKKYNQDLQDIIDGFTFLSECDGSDKLTESYKKYHNNHKKAALDYEKRVREAKTKASKFIDLFGDLWD